MGHRSASEIEDATEGPGVTNLRTLDAHKTTCPAVASGELDALCTCGTDDRNADILAAACRKQPRRKVSHIGAPACFALEMACKQILAAFNDPEEHVGIYVVGSCLERPDWRDVDVRMIMSDRAFARLFPRAYIQHGAAAWEFDPRWTLMTVTISRWLRDQTGLPIDFQFQPMTFANEKHKGHRHALALTFVGSGEGGR